LSGDAVATIADQLNKEQRAALERSALGPGEVVAESIKAKSPEEQALDLSIQRRVEKVAADMPAIWWFSQPTEGYDVSQWWTPQRDQDLRAFVKRPGNDILAGAVSSMTKKFRAMNWVVDGPAATVQWAQDLLGTAEFGRGWGSLVGKTIEDYLTTDNGFFWEIIGKGDPSKPLDGLPVGVAHLDSTKCTRTGDPSYPVVFRNAKTGKSHKLHATRVVCVSDMESPNEDMNGVGFCAVSRVLASSYLLLQLSQYKREKLSDLPQAGLLVLNNVVPQKWEDAKAEYERERRKLGNELWANIMTLIGVDPAQQADAKFISFSNLPDHFDEAATIENYVNIVALAFGTDPRDLWAIKTGSLGSATESQVQHLKARGKTIGDLIGTIERAINWHLFPKRVTFHFDNVDSEEDIMVAQLEDAKISAIMRMYAPDPATGETVATRAEIRQMLADNTDYFSDDFLVVDVTDEVQEDDVDRAEPEPEKKPVVQEEERPEAEEQAGQEEGKGFDRS